MKTVVLLLLLLTPIVISNVQEPSELNYTSSEDSNLQNSSFSEENEAIEGEDERLVKIPLNSQLNLEVEIDEIEHSQEPEALSQESGNSSESSEALESLEKETPSPYIPLLTRCSTDSQCSLDRSCLDGKCLIAPRAFGFLPRFIRCRSGVDCPAGHKCLLAKCIPFRW